MPKKEFELRIAYAIGVEIQRVRLSRDLSQQQLCSKIRLSGNALSRYELGDCTCPIPTLYEICDALSVDMLALLRKAMDNALESQRRAEPMRIRRRNRPPMSDWERVELMADLKERHDAGTPIRTLVRDTGFPYGTIQRLLKGARG